MSMFVFMFAFWIKWCGGNANVCIGFYFYRDARHTETIITAAAIATIRAYHSNLSIEIEIEMLGNCTYFRMSTLQAST